MATVDVMHERCAGIDISKADVKVCIRVPATRVPSPTTTPVQPR